MSSIRKQHEKAKIIQKAFKTTLKLEASDVSKAFKGKTKSVTVRVTKAGYLVASDLEYIIYNAYLKAKKEIPTDSDYAVYGQCKFDSKDINDVGGLRTHDVTTIKQNKKNEALMWADMRERGFLK